MSDDISINIIKQNRPEGPPEESNAPANCSPNYSISSRSEAPEDATVYEGPNEGLFYCENYEEIDDYERDEEVQDFLSVNVDGLTSFASVEDVDIADPATNDSVVHGDIVVYEDDDEYYTAEIIRHDENNEVVELSPSHTSGSKSVPDSSVRYKVNNSNQNNKVQFRFNSGAVPTANSIKSTYDVKGNIDMTPDEKDVSTNDSVILDIDGIGTFPGQIVDINEDEVHVKSTDPKLNNSSNGADVKVDKDKAFQDNFISAVIEGESPQQLLKSQISNISSSTNKTSTTFEDSSVGDVVVASVAGTGTITGKVYNTAYREGQNGSIGIRYNDGYGADTHLWTTKDDIVSIEKLEESPTSSQFGMNHDTISFPNNSSLDTQSSIDADDVVVGDIQGVSFAGVLTDDDNVRIDRSKYSNLDFESGTSKKWELKIGDNEYIEFVEGPGTTLEIDKSKATILGKVDGSSKRDVISTQPSDWSESGNSVKEESKDYQETVNTDSSNDAWYGFIVEMFDRNEDYSDVMDAIFEQITFYGELDKDSYERDFYENNSTVVRRKQKMKKMEHSASRAYAELTKKPGPFSNDVSFGFYDRESFGEANYDEIYDELLNKLQNDPDVNNPKELADAAEDVLDTYNGAGSRGLGTAAAYLAMEDKYNLDSDSHPKYLSDQEDGGRDEQQARETMAAVLQSRGEDVEPEDVDLTQIPIDEGDTMLQFNEKIARLLDDTGDIDKRKKAIKKTSEHTTQLLKDMGVESVPVYRALGGHDLTEDAVESIQNNNKFEIQENSIASYTTSPLKALYFGNNKAGQKTPDERDDFVVYRTEIPSDQILAHSELTPGLNMRGESEALVEGAVGGSVDPEDVIAARGMEESKDRDDATAFFNTPDDVDEHERKVRDISSGVGPAVLESFDENDIDIRNADVEELQQVPGVGLTVAMNITKAYNDDVVDIAGFDWDHLVESDIQNLANSGLYTRESVSNVTTSTIRDNLENDKKQKVDEFANKFVMGIGTYRDREELENEGVSDFLLELFDEFNELKNEFFLQLKDIDSPEELVGDSVYSVGYDARNMCQDLRDILDTYGRHKDTTYVKNNLKEIESNLDQLEDHIERNNQIGDAWDSKHSRPPKERISGDDETTVMEMVDWALNSDLKKDINFGVNTDLDSPNHVQGNWLLGVNQSVSEGELDPSGKGNLISSPTFDQVADSMNKEFRKKVSSNEAGVEILQNSKLEKWRMYVDYAHDIPDWADREEGPRGGIYYDVQDQSLINELLQPPYHEVENPEEYEEIAIGDDGPRQTEIGEFGEDEDRQSTLDEYSIPQKGAHLIQQSEEKEQEYWRVYVDDEEEAPDWATVSGPSPEGNLYYIVFDEDLFAELIEEPQHQTSDDYDLDEYLSNYEGENVEDLEKDSLIIKRKFRVYVQSEGDVPDWARAYEGKEGGIFYVIYNKRLFDEVMSSPKHEIPDDFNLQNYMYGGPSFDEEDRESNEDKDKSVDVKTIDISNPDENKNSNSKFNLIEINSDGSVSKRRIYIDSPSEAPDGKEIHQGDKDGYYYIAESSSEDVDEDKTIEELNDFESKIKKGLENDKLTEIRCSEFYNNIDKVTDKDLLERVYKKETREAVKREIEQWSGQLNKSFEFNYKSPGPSKSENIKMFGQVASLTDASIDEDELTGKERKAVEKWEELKEESENAGKIDKETRGEFRSIIEEVEDDAVLQYLWERGLGDFEDLNTHLSDVLYDRDYSVRTEMIPGILRRLDLKYDYSIYSSPGKIADIVETGEILSRTKQSEIKELLKDVDNADFLNDIKFASIERGVNKDSKAIQAINNRLSELDCRSVEQFNIRYGLYQDIISRPAGLCGEGQGIDKQAWDQIWEKISTDDLTEFARASKERNNEAHSSVIECMLTYRKDNDMTTRDVVDIRFDDGKMSKQKLYSELERVLSRLDPVVGSFLMFKLSKLKSERMGSNKEGYALYRGNCAVDGRFTQNTAEIRGILAHLIGHILHEIVGLDTENKEEINNMDDEVGEGWEYPVMQPKNEQNDFVQEFYERMRKEWKRYTSGDANECRIYQRVSPSEFMAATFAMWIVDKQKLKLVNKDVNKLYNDLLGKQE